MLRKTGTAEKSGGSEIEHMLKNGGQAGLCTQSKRYNCSAGKMTQEPRRASVERSFANNFPDRIIFMSILMTWSWIVTAMKNLGIGVLLSQAVSPELRYLKSIPRHIE